MIFLYPYLLLLFSIPFFFFLYLLYSKKRSLFSEAVKRRLSTSRNESPYTSNSFLWLLLFGLLTLALARPLLLEEVKNETQKMPMGFLAINLDISKSMLAADVVPNRLEFSKNAIMKIFHKLPYFRLSLSAFSRDIFMVAPFTEDKETLSFLLENLDQNSMTSEGSSIEAVMMGAQKTYLPFKRETKDILIVTDGADGLGIQKSIEKAKKYNLRVHLLLVGTKKGSTIIDQDGNLIKDKNEKNVLTKRADELKELSIATQGVFVITNGSLSDLDWLCEQIRIKAQKEDVNRLQKSHSKELFILPLCLAALLLFFIVNSLHVKRFIRFLPLLLLCFTNPQELHSGVFDFWDIIKSQENYTRGKHKYALQYFKKVHNSKNSAATQYNLANSYYRNNDFTQAIKLYLDINTTNQSINYERLHNLGNTYAKTGEVDEAIDAYEKALKIKDEKATRFNLEYLKKNRSKIAARKNKKDEKKSKKKKKKSSGNSKQKDQKKSSKDTQGSQSKASKAMDAKEEKKWKKILRSIKPKTKPKMLIKSQKMEQKNEIFW
ncbi:VWA domain-containing protein [Sulfurospirillum arcachonense]|uniref:VWA domain-containing protein n=1 Tax=Sulfurospirillum arcachonense TaxID=57666 RepID=UPI00046A626B|nr:tetratricopeptide repeat protein [Sulfurospirillum arcachonense]